MRSGRNGVWDLKRRIADARGWERAGTAAWNVPDGPDRTAFARWGGPSWISTEPISPAPNFFVGEADFDPLHDAAQAMMLLEELPDGYGLSSDRDDTGRFWVCDPHPELTDGEPADTPCEAICLAWLTWSEGHDG
jgi:hypothetical protein